MHRTFFAQRCEVKFDYGLRQGRSLPLANRPDAFVTAEGRVVSADKKVAKVNEETMERGRVSTPFLTTS